MRTEHPAKTPSRRTGLFASLASLLRAKGSGAPSARLALGTLCTAILALALTASPASAALVYSTSFGPNGTSATSFEHPGALAVDQSSHNIYVADLANGTVHRFDENHQPAEFSALASPEIGGFTFHPGEAGVSQLAVDPTSHDLYVLNDAPTNSIKALQANGEPAKFTAGPGAGSDEIGGFGELCGLAVDQNGDIYAADYNSGVHIYAPSGEELTSFSATGPCNLAVDSHGTVYVNEYQGPVQRFTPTAFPVVPATTYTEAGTADPSHAYGIAVDPSTDDLYVDEGPQAAAGTAIAQYDASGSRLGTFAGPGEEGELTASEGLAVDASAGAVFVSDAAGQRQVELFAPPPKLPPTVDSSSSANVTSTAAELRAQVNPKGYDTHYRFQYGPTVAYGSQTPLADLGNALLDQTAIAHLHGLQPETTYHYRVLAENANGAPVEGPDRSFTTFPPSASFALPDGRAYELVSPLDKNGGDIRGIEGDEVLGDGLVRPTGDNGGGVVQASTDGNRISYVSVTSFAAGQGAPIGSQYASSRAAESWNTQNISSPTASQTYVIGGTGTPYDAFSADLSAGLELNGVGGFQVSHPVEAPPLAGAPAGYQDYYLNQIHYLGEAASGTGLRSLLTEAPSQPAEKFELEFLGATPNLSHVVLTSGAKLAPEAVEGEYTSGGHSTNLYEWERATGLFQPINILPGGAPDPVSGLLLGDSVGTTDHAISSDGSRVVWTATGTGLYVRQGIGTPQARTVQADASQGGPESGGGRFLTASASSGPGSKIFFADTARLTGDSTATPTLGAIGDLYQFEPENGPEGKLTDLTVEREAGGSANVKGVLGASEDGSYLYFVASGALAPGATQGADNLYLDHEGNPIRFIAALSGNDESGSAAAALGVAFDWETHLGLRTTRVSPDGTLLFMSERSLTGYDNTVANGESCGRDGNGYPLPAQCQEVFTYVPASEQLTCVSCNPSGASPTGPSGIPGATEFHVNKALYDSRLLSDGGGRVFFNSADALLPQDSNGAEDVYEYENGHVHLISNGTSPEGASFVDASADGNDVFLITRAQLLPSDTDQLVDLYDARAPHTPGEVVAFPEPTPFALCSGAACRSSGSSPPVSSPPASATFTGPANPRPKHHKRGHRVKPHHRRHAGANRGGAK